MSYCISNVNSKLIICSGRDRFDFNSTTFEQTRFETTTTAVSSQIESSQGLGKWIVNPKNLYVGRFHPILGNNGFGNPYKVAQNGCQKAVEMYKTLCAAKLTDNQLSFLRIKQVIGCFCKPSELCHSDIILNLL